MTIRRNGRLIAAVAASLVLLQAQPGQCRPPLPAAVPTATQLPHVSITTIGRGSPVVLIPGLSSPRQVWDGIVPALAHDHRVILVQVNGFGGDGPGENLKPGILAGVVADLHGYLLANRLAPAAVVGHSMGGLIGLMLARDHPASVAKLMVVDSLPFVGEIFAPHATVAMLQPQAAAIRDQLAASWGKPADPAAHLALAQRMAVAPPAQARIADWAAHADARVSAQAMYEDMSTDLRPDLGAIAAPITIV